MAKTYPDPYFTPKFDALKDPPYWNHAPDWYSAMVENYIKDTQEQEDKLFLSQINAMADTFQVVPVPVVEDGPTPVPRVNYLGRPREE